MTAQNNYSYEFGPFRLESRERRLLHEGELVILPPKAFDVLLVLIQNNGRLVEREMLIETIWKDTAVEENNLSVNISLIRKALGKYSSGQGYIETVPKHGYRFVAQVKKISEGIIAQKPITTVKESTENQRRNQDLKELKSQTAPITIIHPHLWKISKERLTIIFLSLLVVTAIVYLIISSRYNNLNKILSATANPAITINPDGSWTVIVQPIAEGIKLEKDDLKFELSEGDKIEVNATGEVDIGRGLYGPDGEPDYGDPSMDSPFKDNVGGLEMWIETKYDSKRYLLGSYRYLTVNNSGVPTLRVIESLKGYKDRNNRGYFLVNIKKIAKE